MNLPTTSPADYGPLYTETQFGRFPVEPWNTASNLVFLLIILYFARRTSLDWRRYPLIVGALPILLVGFIGGSLFHATRAHRIFLFMDFMPIFILALAASLHFWLRVVPNKLLVVLLMIGMVVLPRAAFTLLDVDRTLRISVGYTGLAVTILLPAILYCARTGWVRFHLLALAGISFGVAVFFRMIDRHPLFGTVPLLPTTGTHFLWHLFGGMSTFVLMRYITLDYESAVSTSKLSRSSTIVDEI